jgi:predicted ATPase
MIIGMLLRNYKIYYGVKYIPFGYKYSTTIFIGDNGIGKSSILEALDTYFNLKEWNINNESKTRGRTDSNKPFVTVFFLLPINKILNDKDNYEILKIMNDFFWNLNFNDYKSSKEAQKLIKDIENLKESYSKDEYFIFAGGISYENGDEIYLTSFHKKFIDYLKQKLSGEIDENKVDEILKKFFKNFNQYIRKHFSYIYVPVEINLEQFTKLENQDMQRLMGKDIKKEIEKAITKNSLKIINNNLNKFLDDISNNLQMYFYKSKSGRKNISMNELVDKVIELFFSIRTLHKKNEKYPPIPIENLSSGEKKQAIIEVIESFIKKQNNFEKEIIIAIDEPESSLNISKKFNQFEKLLKLSKENIQILITTHWYGFLPIITKGNLYYLSETIEQSKKEVEFLYFDLFNYREKLRNIYDRNIIAQMIELKSINDLVQSIIASLKTEEPYNWLICEGSSEKIYFEYFFNDLIKDLNLRILPVGGYKEVKKIYEYLLLPLKDKDLNNNLKGKIFCLVDTDEQLDRYKSNEENKVTKILQFRRLWNNRNLKKTNLIKMQDDKVSPPTEIEDCLEPNIFYETLKNFNDCKLLDVLEENLDKEAEVSYFAFDLRESERISLKKWFDKNNGYRKIEFAKRYVEIASQKGNVNLSWIKEIKDFFKNNV